MKKFNGGADYKNLPPHDEAGQFFACDFPSLFHAPPSPADGRVKSDLEFCAISFLGDSYIAIASIASIECYNALEKPSFD